MALDVIEGARDSTITISVSVRVPFRLIAAAACCAFVGMGAASASIVYVVNTTATNVYPSGNPLQTDTVLGTITTDGQLSVLSASNILAWDL